tara:strand:+ start:358 stop:822 length:465 start_codon:yes stop_codon:yes gene_type:complete
MSNLILTSILEPKFLTRDYKSNLLNIYRNQYESKGSKLGYIVKVLGIKDIISSNLNNNSEIIVESLCDCDIFKPILGMKVRCIIDMIHINGIFVSKYEIKILIPSSDDYEYHKDFFKTRDGSKYSIGDELDIEIVNIRYDKFIYSCIGKLILKD